MPELRPPGHYRELADRLESLSPMIVTDVLEHDERLDRPALEIVAGPGLERVPATVVRILGEEDVGIYSVDRRPDGYFVVLAV